ncbi:MAG: cation:proton antiporter [Saprospiraceae bacterium]
MLSGSGHGELLTVFWFFATFITGAYAFELVGLKPDLGALLAGMLLVKHRKADELYDRMMGYKDFFLIAFFIYVGLTGKLNWNVVLATWFLFPLMFFKGAIFMSLFSDSKSGRVQLTLHRSALVISVSFALITGLIGYKAGWVPLDWITVFALLMTLSFMAAISFQYRKRMKYLTNTETNFGSQHPQGQKYIDEEPKSIGDAQYMVVGYGSIGRPAYHYLKDELGLNTIAIDYNHPKW